MEAPLQIRDLRKRYGRHEVLAGVDLSLEAGAIHGLVGLNGAGKTTTLQCTLGLLPHDGGDISVMGLPPAALHRSRGKVAVVFDEPCLHPHLTVSQVLRHAALLTGVTDKSRLAELLKLLGLERYRDFKVRHLSLGNRRRTSIAQALVGDPAFILLDEPFNGLDAGGVDDLLALIARLNRERGISFLLASHQLSYLEQICSHLAILHRGRIVASDRVEFLLRNRQTRLSLLVGSPGAALDLLRGMEGVTVLSAPQADIGAPARILCELQDLSAASLNRALVDADVEVHELVPQRHSLEALFREMTGGGSDG